MTLGDMYERHLFTMEDADWNKASLDNPRDASGAVVTGDPVIDALERDLAKQTLGEADPLFEGEGLDLLRNFSRGR